MYTLALAGTQTPPVRCLLLFLAPGKGVGAGKTTATQRATDEHRGVKRVAEDKAGAMNEHNKKNRPSFAIVAYARILLVDHSPYKF